MTLVYVGGPLQPLTHPARARPVEAYRRIALPLIIDRECEHALSASFHQWATRGVSPNLVDRSVEVQNPVLGQEFAGTESNACSTGAVTRDFVNGMSG